MLAALVLCYFVLEIERKALIAGHFLNVCYSTFTSFQLFLIYSIYVDAKGHYGNFKDKFHTKSYHHDSYSVNGVRLFE